MFAVAAGGNLGPAVTQALPAQPASTGSGGDSRSLDKAVRVVDAADALDARRTEADRALRANDIESLKKLHDQVNQDLGVLRLALDEALFTGAWNRPAFRKIGFEASGRIEGVRILNLMSRAILTGYAHPTNAIPASAADATSKMFEEVARLKENVRALDGLTTTPSRSGSGE
jgi:hypothetical protein